MSDLRKMLDDYNAFNSGKSDPDFNKSSSSRIPSALRQSEKNPPVRSKMLDDYNAFNSGKSDSDNRPSGGCFPGCSPGCFLLFMAAFGWIMALIDWFIVDFM